MSVIKAEKKIISTSKEETKTKNDYRLLDKIMIHLFCEEYITLHKNVFKKKKKRFHNCTGINALFQMLKSFNKKLLLVKN